ncbi:HpcH/HpaI aldolase/citrate lyase family protein [Cupriavidus basilensis]|uniref:Citrate lyase beta chain n=1 Tax=Cupriavidus basilensis TaxID=68895 RepID=A0A0C4YJB2_9BURK|nr:aldolase/citrate lyase family protein [Cupriavidus basilensis]AJG22705.1 Citrate lyase beta chain [Cupriavidus basilensis]
MNAQATRRPPGLRRSWLFVPGLDPVRQHAALESGPDVVVADLEEFTSPADRPAARARIAALMGECRARGIVGAVRINKLDGDGLDDLHGVLPGAPAAVLLPHTESGAQILALDQQITGLERELGLPHGHTEIVPTLESARGIVAAPAILSASPRVSACLLAAEDLSADLDAVRGPDGIELHHVRARFLVDCIAAGCVPIDCPFNYQDATALAADLAWARRIGLKAKCTVFPHQVAAIHAALTPSAQQVAQAQDRVGRYEAARDGKPAQGPRIDSPDYNTARRLLARHAGFVQWAQAARCGGLLAS